MRFNLVRASEPCSEGRGTRVEARLFYGTLCFSPTLTILSLGPAYDKIWSENRADCRQDIVTTFSAERPAGLLGR